MTGKIVNVREQIIYGDITLREPFTRLIAVSDPPMCIGGGGIRTHDTFTRIHAFQACSIGRSDTPPKALSVLKNTLTILYLTR